jgi:membrane protein
MKILRLQALGCSYILLGMLNKLKRFASNIWAVFSDAVVIGVMKHDAVELAGYLAYLNMLSLFPFLVLLIFGLGQLGELQIGANFIQLLLENLPPHATVAIKPRIEEILKGPPEGFVTISIFASIWTASSTVEGLRTVLNRAYRVYTPPAYIFRRILSMVQLLVLMLIIIIGLTLMVLMPLLREWLQQWLGATPSEQGGFAYAIFLMSIFALFLVVCTIYYILPNIKQRFINVAPGAVLTVLLWLWAISFYSYYLSKFNQVSIIYGSLGGVIASLLFFFLINFCLIMGAEVNYQLSQVFGFELKERERTVERMD